MRRNVLGEHEHYDHGRVSDQLLSSDFRIPHYYNRSPPLFMMANGELHQLWFVVDGDPAPPTKVPIESGHDIDDLKRAVNYLRNDILCSHHGYLEGNSPYTAQTARG